MTAVTPDPRILRIASVVSTDTTAAASSKVRQRHGRLYVPHVPDSLLAGKMDQPPFSVHLSLSLSLFLSLSSSFSMALGVVCANTWQT